MEKYSFKEVMKHWGRYCKAYRDSHNLGCIGCPLGNVFCLGLSPIDEIASSCDNMERYIMKWAEDNPEPIYPTWGEWLIQQGIAKLGDGMLAVDNVKAVEHIPDDIAKKLGIKPK